MLLCARMCMNGNYLVNTVLIGKMHIQFDYLVGSHNDSDLCFQVHHVLDCSSLDKVCIQLLCRGSSVHIFFTLDYFNDHQFSKVTAMCSHFTQHVAEVWCEQRVQHALVKFSSEKCEATQLFNHTRLYIMKANILSDLKYMLFQHHIIK